MHTTHKTTDLHSISRHGYGCAQNVHLCLLLTDSEGNEVLISDIFAVLHEPLWPEHLRVSPVFLVVVDRVHVRVQPRPVRDFVP